MSTREDQYGDLWSDYESLAELHELARLLAGIVVAFQRGLDDEGRLRAGHAVLTDLVGQATQRASVQRRLAELEADSTPVLTAERVS